MKKLFFVAVCLVNCAFAQHSTKLKVTDLDNADITLKMETNGSSLLSALNKAFASNTAPELDHSGLTVDAVNAILPIWETSPIRCYETSVIEKAVKRSKGGYEIRNIPLFVKEAAKGDEYQEAVLVFNSEGKIDNIYISLEQSRYKKILSEGTDVTDIRRRQMIIDFVENFRTSYNRKDITFLNNVFSEDALIIVGKVLKTKEGIDGVGKMINNLPAEKIQYTRVSKSDYLKNMTRLFVNNKYLNIKFDEIEITKHSKYPDYYGVNLKQAWNTPTYSDQGFVFLMLDFSDENNPIIHIRTWQPEKLNGKTLSNDEKFKLSMFGKLK